MFIISPGVYWREYDFSQYVPQLASTIFGVVITATKGPINELKFCSDIERYVTKFGPPHPDHIGTYAAMQYLRDGKMLWVVRVESTTNPATIATGVMPDSLGNTVFNLQSPDPGSFYNNIAARVTWEKPKLVAGEICVPASDVDGTTSSYTFDLNNAPVIPGSVHIRSFIDGNIVDATDDGNGNITGANLPESYTEAPLQGNGADNTFTATLTYSPLPTTLNVTTVCGGVSITGTDDGSGAISGSSTSNIAGEVNGTGDGVATDFNFNLAHAHITPGTYRVHYTIGGNVYQGSDDGSGTVSGTNLSGTIDYTTGAVSLTFTNPPDNGTSISSDYTYTLNVTGTVDYAARTVNLTYDENVDAGEDITFTYQYTDSVTGTIDYRTGHCTIQWSDPPDAGTAITSEYSYYRSFKIETIYRRNNKLVPVETFVDLSMDNTDEYYYAPTVVNSGSNFLRLIATANNAWPAAGTYWLSGGDDGMTGITEASYVGIVIGNVKTGLQLMRGPEDLDVNILAVPGISDSAVVFELNEIANERRDCMAIIDPPLGLDIEQVLDYVNGAGMWDAYPAINSSYVAVYWPWVKMYDAYNSQYVWTPPSGWAAGVWARSDYNRDLNQGPAGVEVGILHNAISVEYSPRQGERDLLQSEGNINPIVDFKGEGIMLYGQKTMLREPSVLSRVAPRRTLIYIEKAIATAVKPLQFRPHTDRLWRDFKTIVIPFLESMQHRGLLFAGTPQEKAYYVVADERTNTPETIDNFLFKAQIMLKLTRQAESILLDFLALKTGAKFEEYIGTT